VFRLDSSNIRDWEPAREDLAGTLESAIEHLKSDRTEQDVLYELLLKLGLDLCVPIETKTLADKTVHSVGGGVLIACLAQKLAADEIEPLGLGIVEWRKALAPAGDTTCVFRDSAFPDDVAKTNLAAILEQNGITHVRSLPRNCKRRSKRIRESVSVSWKTTSLQSSQDLAMTVP
jgi:adenine-specific DNA-methyltransferase